jgi:hypothetical protein
MPLAGFKSTAFQAVSFSESGLSALVEKRGNLNRGFR